MRDDVMRELPAGSGGAAILDRLAFDIKRKILGENAARLYGIDIAAQRAKLDRQQLDAGA